MKIKEEIRTKLFMTFMAVAIAALGTYSSAVANTPKSEAELFKFFDQIIESSEDAGTSLTTPGAHSWAELEKFTSMLYRAMALDPGPGNNVPPSQVPKELFAAVLNQEIIEKWNEIKKSDVPKNARAQFEFEQYAQVVDRIIAYRKTRSFPQARAIAKRGEVEQAYQAFVGKFSVSAEAGSTTSGKSFKDQIAELKEQTALIIQAQQRKEVFSGGGKFIWFAFALLVGFGLGIAAFRFSPEYFEKLMERALPASSKAPVHPSQQLKYESWLQDFEGILGRIKNSQQVHERRIEEVVTHSEKITQQALSLYADARIKNEANLEHRMGSLLREIQTQMEHSQKLQAGDRVQIQMMLEHCLKLCDAIETKSVEVKSAS